MDFMHAVFFQWIYIFTFTVGLGPPQNVNIIIKDNNVTFTWNLPPEFVPTPTTRAFRGTHVSVVNVINKQVVLGNYTRLPGTSLTTTVLSQCQQYTVSLKSVEGGTRSDPVKILFWTTKLSKPKNVVIKMKDKHVYISWTLPSEFVTATHLEVYNGSGIQKVISTQVKFPNSSFILSGLSSCQQYTIKLRIGNHSIRSENVERTFWTADKVFTADINSNVNLTWTTGLGDFYKVNAPNVNIYSVLGGSISQNSDNNHYKNYSVGGKNIHIGVVNVTQKDGGLYKSESELGGVDGCCLLKVTDKPKKPELTYDKYPFLGFPTVFTCRSEVQRWPADPAASLNYTFTATGQQQKHRLTINVTKFDKGKRISCTATDDLEKTSDSSDVLTVDPFYGPKNISISPPGNIVNVTEGDSLPPINCSADCNPDCKYVWTNSSYKRFKDGNILKIDNVERKHNGTYRCRVTHANDTNREKYPNGTKRFARIDVNINVLYPPTISSLQFSTVSNRYTQYYSTNYEFNEDNHVFIRIHVDSNPEPHLYFYSKSFSKKELKYNISSNYYTALLPPLNCEESGQYTIEADNGIKNSTNTTVQLIIQCKPKRITPERRTIGTKIGASENIIINVVAYPKPAARWLNGSKSVWEVEQSGTNNSYKLTSAVQIKDQSEFGQYGVQINNSVGTERIYIELAPKDKPQPPLNVSIVDIFTNKANVTWIAGFDGGDKQSFSIKYKKSTEHSFTTIPLAKNGMKKDTILSYMVTGLAPSTYYTIYVIAQNSFGYRNRSTEFITYSEAALVGKSGGSPIIIICGAIAGLVVLIVAVLGICYKTKQNSNREESTINKVEYATVNKSSARRQDEATAAQENAAGARNDIYASVDKTKKKKKAKDKCVDKVETEYADVGQCSRNIEINPRDINEKPGTSGMTDAKQAGRTQNQDGLTYIEVTFSKNTSDRKPIIHGIEDRTEYIDIDLTRRAEPLQDDSD